MTHVLVQKGPMGTVLDGKEIADRIKQELLSEIAALKASSAFYPPRLAILSFATPTSKLYLGAQAKQASALGVVTNVRSQLTDARGRGFVTDVGFVFPKDVTQGQIEEVIQGLNESPSIHGIFVHQPMPPQVDPQRISVLIDPRKDVEGIHPQNSARRFFAKARIGSCTALAVMELIESTGVSLEGKEAVVVGHSEIVGRPVSMLLLDKLATTTICHLGTDKAGRLEDHVRRADVLVVAVGRPQFIKGAWIKPGAIVIDVGINVVQGRVVGDVEFEAATSRAAFISPVPGGVGPVTVMMVMKNTIEAFKLQHRT